MKEYIEREALTAELAKGTIITDDIYGMGIMAGIDFALETARSIPSADVVEVVRCKDCKHGEVDAPDDFPNLHYCHEGCGWNNADFYCKSGERRDNDATD